MDFDPASLDFLDHFDRPKTADDDQPEPVAGFICDEQGRIACPEQEIRTERVKPIRVAHRDRPVDPPVDWDLIDALPDRPAYTRGVGWVLLWAGSLAVFAIVAGMLAQVGYLVAAEHSLKVAARAAATEATLPRASYQSVVATVNRRLESQPQLAGHLTLTMLQNGVPVLEKFQAREGDHFSVTLSAPATSAIPDWLMQFSLCRAQSTLTAEATHQLPGRKLSVKTPSRTGRGPG